MHKLQIDQRSPEWLKLRSKKIGSSDAPVIAGVSPYKTPYQLWEEKLLEKTQEITPAMQRGIDLEPVARQAYEAMTGYLCMPCIVLHPSIDWKWASLDGLDIDEKHIVEIKCANKEDHKIAASGNVPEKYMPQLQHQMDVCELDEAHYASYSGQDLIIVLVKRDQVFINRLNEQEEEFYDKILTLSPPAYTSKDLVTREDEEWARLASEWNSLALQQALLEESIKKTREALIGLCKEKNCQGAGIKISRFIKKGNIDYGSIPELREIDLEQYRKAPIDMWRVSKTKE